MAWDIGASQNGGWSIGSSQEEVGPSAISGNKIYINGEWKVISNCLINIGGEWKATNAKYVRKDSQWKEIPG